MGGGCATGEEAYSIAILLQEHADKLGQPCTVQVFAIDADVGRPVEHIASNLVGDVDLVAEVRRVLADLAPHEAEVRTRSGTWFQMRIRPYRTLDNVIEGAVITFADISELKQAQRAANRQRVLAEGIVTAVREPLLVLDGQMRIVSANPAFFRSFGGSATSDVERGLFELDGGRWDLPELRHALAEVQSRGTAFEALEVVGGRGPGEHRTLVLNARRVAIDGSEPDLILLAFEPTTPPDPDQPALADRHAGPSDRR